MGSHPVLSILHARRAAGSRPLAREDGARVALVVEGGAMRGVVSSAMTAALERAGLTGAFDLVVGTSAGALNGSALLAGVAEACCEAYSGDFLSRHFIDLRRLLTGRPAVDVAWTLDFVSERLDAGRHQRTLASPVELHCLAVDVETCEPAVLTGMGSAHELRAALLASSRMPFVGGQPVQYRGRRYMDGGLADPIPVGPAVAAGATHLLVLQTRPHGVPRASPGRLADRLIERRLRTINPGLVSLYRRRIEDYERVVRELAGATDGPPHLLCVRPPAGAPTVDQLERRPDRLRAAAAAARRQMQSVLDDGTTSEGGPR
jgi:predicted patatin/cPLA2 family phospholipase